MLDRSAAAHQAGDDIEARQALGAYLVLRVIDRVIGLQDDDAPEAREGLQFQLASVTRFIEELPKDEEVEASHLAGLVRVLGAFERDGERRLRIGLLAYSWHLEQAGCLEEALDVLGLSEPFYRKAGPDELTNLGMTAGRFHRTLAHWDLADSGYQLGYESAEVRHDRRGMLLARLGRAKVLLGRGNLPEARRQIEGVIAEAEGKDLAEARAWGYADLAVVLEKLGLPESCLAAEYQAFNHFRDSQERCRALNNLGASLRNLRQFEVARIAFESVLRTSESWYLRTNAFVELLGIHGALGNELAFHRYWNEAREEESKMPPMLRVDYGYRVGLGLLRFGKGSAGRRWLEEARSIARERGLNEWYFRLDQLLSSASPETELRREIATPAAESSDELARIEGGLRQYAAALSQ